MKQVQKPVGTSLLLHLFSKGFARENALLERSQAWEQLLSTGSPQCSLAIKPLEHPGGGKETAGAGGSAVQGATGLKEWRPFNPSATKTPYN